MLGSLTRDAAMLHLCDSVFWERLKLNVYIILMTMQINITCCNDCVDEYCYNEREISP